MPPKGLRPYNVQFYRTIAHDPRYRVGSVYELFYLGQAGPDRVNVCIRHDVDRALNLVLPIAEYEDALGIHTSYYFLTETAPYDLWSSDVPRKLVEMGHEVGLHSDQMYEQAALGRDALQRLHDDVRRLGKLCRAPIKGVTWHGGAYLRPFKVHNYDLYEDFSPSDLGLEYHDSVFYKPGTRKWRMPILSDAENNLRFVPGKPGWMLRQGMPGDELLYVAHPRAMFRKRFCQELNWPDFPHFPPVTAKRTLLMDLKSLLAYNKLYLGERKVRRIRMLIRILEKLPFIQ